MEKYCITHGFLCHKESVSAKGMHCTVTVAKAKNKK